MAAADPLARYDDIFEAASKEWNVDPALLKAVARQESGGDPQARSGANAQGIMQIVPKTARDLGVTDPFDPVQSIFGGAKYLNEALDKEGRPDLALLYYHGGPGWRRAYGTESRDYVPAVSAHYAAYKARGNAPAAASAPAPAAARPAAPAPAAPAPSVDDLHQAFGEPGGTTPKPGDTGKAGNASPSVEDLNAAFGPPAAATPKPAGEQKEATKPGEQDPGARGYARNVAAGAVEGVTGGLSMLADPSGSLLQLPVRVLGTGYDALARGTGWFPPMSDQLRRDLYGQTPDVTETQMVPRAVNALGGTIQEVLPGGSDKPVMPADVQSATPGQARARAATSGLVGGALFGMPVRGAVAGGGGEVAKEYVPEWVQPGVEAVTNALVFGSKGAGEGAKDAVRTGIRYTGSALEQVTRPATTALERALTYGKGGAEEEAAFAGTDRGRIMARVREIAEEGGARRGGERPPPGDAAANGWRPMQPGEALSPGQEVATSADGRQWVRATEPAGGGPSPGMGGPQPQSAGAAATPRGMAGLTAAEEQAYRTTAEGQKWLEPQQQGHADRNLYVRGSLPNLVEQEQSVNLARELKALGIRSEEASQDARAGAAANNEARTQHFAEIARTANDRLTATDARQAQADTDLAAAWRNKRDADASPVVELADQIKASPDGRRPAVREAVDSVTAELRQADGSLHTDPEQLYGVRKHIDDMLSPEGLAKRPLNARVQANLLALKEALDGAIEPAATGFQQYLRNFSEASRRIDEMEALQGHEKGLFDGAGGQNRMTYNKVQNMMRTIVDRRASPGFNKYKSITDETMQRLWDLRDDLRRSASALELARTPGSDTTQNLWDMVKGISTGPEGKAILHGVVGAHLGPVGNIGLAVGGRILGHIVEGRGVARDAARAQEILRPNPNALIDPRAP